MSLFKVRSGKPASPKTLTTRLCDALQARRTVTCVYEGGGRRTIEPYAHGHSKTGTELLSAYQVDGPTEPGWKMFDVGKLTELELTDERFEIRPDYNAADPGLTQIHCRQQ